MTNEEIVKKVVEHDVRLDTLDGRMDVVESKVEDIHQIATSVATMSHDMSYIKTDISEVKASQAELKTGQDELRDKVVAVENAPDKNKSRIFDAIVEKVVWAILGGALAYVLFSIAPNVFGK